MKTTTEIISNQYSLSIRFTSDGFSLFIFDENQKLLSSKKTPADLFSLTEDKLFDLLANEKELSLNFHSIRVVFETDIYSVIPKVLFDATNAKDMLTFQHAEANIADTILYNELLAWNAVLTFTIPKAINSAIRKILPEVDIEHHIIDFVNDEIALQNDSSIHIYVRNNRMDIIALKNGKLTLINTYDFSTKEDFLYYVMNIYEQLSLDSEKCNTSIYNANKKPELAELVGKYIKNCKAVN